MLLFWPTDLFATWKPNKDPRSLTFRRMQYKFRVSINSNLNVTPHPPSLAFSDLDSGQLGKTSAIWRHSCFATRRLLKPADWWDVSYFITLYVLHQFPACFLAIFLWYFVQQFLASFLSIFLLHQFLASFLAMLPGFTFGSLLGYAAVAVPQVIDSSSLSALSSSPALLLSEKRINLFIVDCSQIFFSADESKFDWNSHRYLPSVLAWWDSHYHLYS